MKKGLLAGLAGGCFIMGLLTLGVFLIYQPRPTAPPLPVRGVAPTFALTASDGAVFDTASLKGKVWVASLFFSTCGGPCPTMSQNMQTLHRRFEGRPDVHLVNISVDPQTDVPDRLTLYAKKLGADTNRWHFLTGPVPEIKRVAGLEGFALVPGDQLLNHSTRFLLVDGAGMIRGHYDGLEAAAVILLAEDIETLLKAPAAQAQY